MASMLPHQSLSIKKYMLHNCSMHIKQYEDKHNCSICKKDMSHKLQIRDYFNNLDKALCQ